MEMILSTKVKPSNYETETLKFKCNTWTIEQLEQFLLTDFWDTLVAIRNQKYKDCKNAVVNGQLLTINRETFKRLKEDKIGMLFALFDGALVAYKEKGGKHLKTIKELQRRHNAY